MTGVIWGKNLMCWGSRPFAAACARIFCTVLSVSAGLFPPQKTASAWFAAKADPAVEVPAWKITGTRCGEGRDGP